LEPFHAIVPPFGQFFDEVRIPTASESLFETLPRPAVA